ncbi:hypothetical protein BD324DRAFT_651644 [Kockovaella imperatae]|uniref:Transcription initiation factor TFIID subunit 4 n=1 Tax=Kockovaella imperatae TaxID=4999 RepID=A0A1Y1UFW8_9TREE|nr:hypothetical protein BD324DRAFT_651644 [Kockovaella imperatae]ORX36404.1 hypothetical protein BD324DRAFT_651644 [Kockovaella imperatae]
MAAAGSSNGPVPGSIQAPIPVLDNAPVGKSAPSVGTGNPVASTSTSTLSLASKPAAPKQGAHSTPYSVPHASPLGSNGGKSTDLFGRGVLRARLESMAREHSMMIDEDVLTYLALAAEARLRSLISSAMAAQLHRTTSSHVRAPPPSKSTGQPMWSHVAVSDPNAVLEALSKENKEAEQSFRANRMDRIAREAEFQRAKERAERIVASEIAAKAGGGGPSNVGEGGGEGEEANGENGEDAEINGVAGGSGTATPIKASTSTGNSPPVFGAVSERKTPSSGRKSGKKAARDVSAEVAHKLSNATAMRSAGMFSKKQYSWLTSVPPVSSPLAGRKRKDGEGEGEEGGAGTGESSKQEGNAGTPLPKKKKKRDKGGGKGGQVDDGAGADGDLSMMARRRPRLSVPTRREIVVARDAGGEERKVTDDKVLTMDDLIFALEREGVGRGMGSTDEIVTRVRALGDVRSREGSRR